MGVVVWYIPDALHSPGILEGWGGRDRHLHITYSDIFPVLTMLSRSNMSCPNISLHHLIQSGNCFAPTTQHPISALTLHIFQVHIFWKLCSHVWCSEEEQKSAIHICAVQTYFGESTRRKKICGSHDADKIPELSWYRRNPVAHTMQTKPSFSQTKLAIHTLQGNFSDSQDLKTQKNHSKDTHKNHGLQFYGSQYFRASNNTETISSGSYNNRQNSLAHVILTLFNYSYNAAKIQGLFHQVCRTRAHFLSSCVFCYSF